MPSSAESWPQRQVRIVVPIGAATVTDVAARLYAERLAARWKQPVVIENRPGADGLVGAAAFAAMRDDHTLLYSFAAPVSLFPVLQEKLPYDPVRDLVPISGGAVAFLAVATVKSLPAASLRDLIALARTRPGQLNYNAGAGALPYFFAGALKRVGIEMVLVSYRETKSAVQDLAEGRIQVMLTGLSEVQPLAQAGKISLLAVTNKTRAPTAPEVPTAVEAGVPELDYEGGTGFFGPRDMPTALTEQIAADIRAVAADPAFVDRLAAVGLVARGSTPAGFAADLERQRAQIAEIARAIGNKPGP
jgi:tripartite-type tricarboxylate transporter receptor subunit TctC